MVNNNSKTKQTIQKPGTNQGRSLEGPCQEGRRIFFIFFAKLYILQTQQRLAPLISKFSAAAFNVLRQTLIWIKVDQKERACLAD